jgi:hypothetical protein
MAKHVSTTGPRAIAPAKTDWQRTERDIQRRIDQATLGLGCWRDSDMPDWNKVPFSHYVTNVHEWDRNETWVNWATGITIALVAHPAGEAFTRGMPYAWCKTGKRPMEKETFSMEPVFGRFIASTPRGPKVLVRNGVAAVLGKEYDHAYRPVGVVHRDDAYPRSFTPAPIPCEAIRRIQPMHFRTAQDYLRRLDQILCAMAGVVDMTDELADAEKAAGKEDCQARSYRQSRAYEALEPILTDAMRWSGHTREELEAFHQASPSLAYWLERWQADKRADCSSNAA